MPKLLISNQLSACLQSHASELNPVGGGTVEATQKGDCKRAVVTILDSDCFVPRIITNSTTTHHFLFYDVSYPQKESKIE